MKTKMALIPTGLALGGSMFLAGCLFPSGSDGETDSASLSAAAATASAYPVTWVKKGSNARDIGGGMRTWIVGNDLVVRKYSFQGLWEASDGRGYMIDVGPTGMPWINGTDKQVWRAEGQYNVDQPNGGVVSWGLRGPGFKACDVGVGRRDANNNFEAWAIQCGVADESGNSWVYKYDIPTNAWKSTGMRAVKVDVQDNGYPWLVRADGQIYQWTIVPPETTPRWKEHFGIKATDIGVGRGDNVWITGFYNNTPDGDKEIFRYNSASKFWDKAQGVGLRITVDDVGNPWVVKAKGDVMYGVLP